MVEVAYVSGVDGANLFVLTPHGSATLAAVMMGLDEPMGDGLSDIELSAVAEAMNQMMGAAAERARRTPWPRWRSRSRRPSARSSSDADEARAHVPRRAVLRPGSSSSPTGSPPTCCSCVPADVRDAPRGAFGRPRRAASRADAGAHRRGDGVHQRGGRAVDGRHRSASTRLRDVQVRVSAELGRARVPVSDGREPAAGCDRRARPDTVRDDRHPRQRPCLRPARLVLVDGEYAAQIVSLEPPTLMAG